MQLWADVYDASGMKLGAGPVASLLNASVTRALDGAGTVQAEALGTDERALSLLQNERRWRVYWQADAETPRELGRGIIRGVKVRGSSASWRLSVDGPDALDELVRANTLLGRIYPAVTLGALVGNLASLAGWTASVESGLADKVLSARFDGESVLKAIRTLCQQNGVHLRYGGGSLIEVGAFGQASGVRLVQADYAPVELYGRDGLMLIESLSVETDSESLCNWLIPVGGGEGESTLSLQYATRQTPYSVRVNYDNGKPLYYLADDASISRYGRIQKVLAFKSIAPISNSDADLLAAANQLHDAASAYLQRHAQPLTSYSVVTLKAGDKVRLVYKGLVYRDNEPTTYIDVDEDVWVMKVSERVGDGASLSLTLATVDRYAEDAVTIVANALESIQVRDLRVQPYPTTAPFVYRRELAPGFPADVPINITNGVLYLNQCRLRFTTRPFRATSKAESASETVTGAGGALITTTESGGGATSAAGGDHNHRVLALTSLSGFPSTSARPYLGRNAAGGASLYAQVNTNADNDLWTESSSGDHTHALPAHAHSLTLPPHTHSLPALLVNYGIVDDEQTPSGVRVQVNGVDVTDALGGPWAVTGGAVDHDIDITRYLVNASGGLRQKHSVRFSCTGGQGEVEVSVELRLTVQSIALGDAETGGTLQPNTGIEGLAGALRLEQAGIPLPVRRVLNFNDSPDLRFHLTDADLKTQLSAELTPTGVVAGAYPKVWVDTQGRVSAGLALEASDLPHHFHGAGDLTSLPLHTHSAADLTSLPSHSHAASDILSGTLDSARLPPLTAAQITSGVLDLARLPALPASQLTSGTLNPARLPSLQGASPTSAGVQGAVPAPAAGQHTRFLRGDGSWQTVAGTAFPFAILEHQVSQGGQAPQSVANVWTSRTLNTKVIDAQNIVTLAGNQLSFTPLAGAYLLIAQFSAGDSTSTYTVRWRLRNISQNLTAGGLSVNHAIATALVFSMQSFCTSFETNGTDAFALQYFANAVRPMGLPNNISGENERYISVNLIKIA